MRSLSILLALSLGTAHAGEGGAPSPNATYQKITDPAEVIGRWSFSDKWWGYMGMAIEFKKHEFKYWFSSDHQPVDSPKYPIVGTWKLVDGRVVMKAPEGASLYSNKWAMARFGNIVGLADPDDAATVAARHESPDSRMLTKITDSHSDWPVLNTPAVPKWRISGTRPLPPRPLVRKTHGFPRK